jgi:hypothetical protein
LFSFKTFTFLNLAMASFSACLHLAGNIYLVVVCRYSFYQHIDHRGRPRSQVRKGPIYVELYVLDDTADIVA